jgi:hypothetical protein
MTDLINLIYASSAIQEMTNDELLALLAKAREKNERLNITGMLLYRGGNFLQVLEGDKAEVETLFKVIAQDPRHKQVSHLLTRPVPAREFAEWQMGFVDLDHLDPTTIPGYTPFLKESFSSERFHETTYAYTFLRMFKEKMR